VEKLIVISAPSGAGKTSIVHFLLKQIEVLSFSVSACSRARRKNETDGIDYHFLAVEEFQQKIKKGDFLEWEEVYKNQYYGTLKSELKRIWREGKTIIFDVDVVGGVNIKKQYSSECLSIFIMPPSLAVLEERLQKRGSESADSLQKRVTKAKGEIARSGEFDKVILNDDFVKACREAMEVIQKFIG
jgi:guanylate kinase|tara:strand:+ start:134 stop:694 length:561 start_codon:yes stop_codon:yes gene_type:complete